MSVATSALTVETYNIFAFPKHRARRTQNCAPQKHPGRQTDLFVGDLIGRYNVRKFGAGRLEGRHGELDCVTQRRINGDATEAPLQQRRNHRNTML